MSRVGPVLYLRGRADGRVALAALVLREAGDAPGPLTTEHGAWQPEPLARRDGMTAYRYAFELPARAEASYRLDGTTYRVAADHEGDLRIAYVSCNGQEAGDLDRDHAERNAMWARLGERHADRPFHLLLNGGDQIYADEATQAHPASAGWPEDVPRDLPEAEGRELSEALERAFFRRYATLYAQPEFARLAAEVPSLAMWDDHDICDGWGSLPEEALDSEVGRRLLAAARANFLLFQFAVAPDAVPGIVIDRSGASLGWCVDLPGLRLIAPDLRSERRPDRIMGARGWEGLRRALDTTPPGRVLFLSSVPVLGPRLSLVEAAMRLTPWAEEYEDDLRDQWQSRAHRDEWREMLARAGRAARARGGARHRAFGRDPPGDAGDDGDGGGAAAPARRLGHRASAAAARLCPGAGDAGAAGRGAAAGPPDPPAPAAGAAGHLRGREELPAARARGRALERVVVAGVQRRHAAAGDLRRRGEGEEGAAPAPGRGRTGRLRRP